MTLAKDIIALARRGVGVLANNLLALDGSAKLPAVDGSQLTGLLKGGATVTLTGTAVDVTGIPATAKRITIALDNLSLSGTAHALLQLGTSSGVENTGYVSDASISTTGSGGSGGNQTSGFWAGWAGGAAVVSSSILTLVKGSGNKWIASLAGGVDNGSSVYYGFVSGGNKLLGGVLDRIRLTSTNGTDTFDLGTATVYWE
ncbi:hypothetical protein [Pleomorphomonas oryzae]|uniref:hypothetical protein n=1 Tax=Pleomorphomonas oryzae TaxID=261934 RepID=UPI000479DEEF|nr:hypothetical protein [Pleomorphomonas oryzae]